MELLNGCPAFGHSAATDTFDSDDASASRTIPVWSTADIEFNRHVVGQAIAAATCKPRVWLQASTATIYAHRYDSPNDEYSGILGGQEPDAPDTRRFSIDVARAWERAPLKNRSSMELGRLRFGPQ